MSEIRALLTLCADTGRLTTDLTMTRETFQVQLALLDARVDRNKFICRIAPLDLVSIAFFSGVEDGVALRRLWPTHTKANLNKKRVEKECAWALSACVPMLAHVHAEVRPRGLGQVGQGQGD